MELILGLNLPLRFESDNQFKIGHIARCFRQAITLRDRLQFELRNLNGCQFSIDNVEFPFDVLTRKTS